MKNKKRYLIIAIFLLLLLTFTACNKSSAVEVYEPIAKFNWKKILDYLVWPMAFLMWGLGKSIAFNLYGLMILFATIIVRTAAWPIYAKTNDMSLKMKIVEPEMAKLQKKYAGKEDPESKQRMQMEQMQLYKKYGIGLSGCLMPFIQFPIFMAFYQTIQRIPLTNSDAGGFFDFSVFNHTIFGIDLYKGIEVVEATGKWNWSSWQTWGIVVLAVLVGITQIGMQILTTKRQNKAKDNTLSTIPEYRKPAQTDQQKQTEMTMKIMMYAMTVMMVFFVLRSAGALGLYWFIGNLYSGLQSAIGYKNSEKRLEKLKRKY